MAKDNDLNIPYFPSLECIHANYLNIGVRSLLKTDVGELYFGDDYQHPEKERKSIPDLTINHFIFSEFSIKSRLTSSEFPHFKVSLFRVKKRESQAVSPLVFLVDS